jgi:hypothetical protein
MKKFKARFCACGDQQLKGIDFSETYAPVVQWTTIQLMFVLEILLGLKSMQSNITCAFMHTNLEKNKEVYKLCDWGSPSMVRMARKSALSSKRHSMP